MKKVSLTLFKIRKYVELGLACLVGFPMLIVAGIFGGIGELCNSKFLTLIYSVLFYIVMSMFAAIVADIPDEYHSDKLDDVNNKITSLKDDMCSNLRR